MSGEIEVFLDETPGETRGLISRDGRYTHLFIERDGDVAALKLGARSIGRVAEIDSGLKGAFVELVGGAAGFLPLGKSHDLRQGQKIEVEVSAEPREMKVAALRRIGAGEGDPRLVKAGPKVVETLTKLAPGVEIQTGVFAIEAAWEAEEEALSGSVVLAGAGLDLAIQRTRAMVTVDIDHAGKKAAGGAKQANLLGLHHAARLIRLNRWGGLVAFDLVGTGQDGDALLKAARDAFGGDPEVVFGPLNRFGVLMLSLPWRRRPLDEILNGSKTSPTLESRAIAIVRRLRHAMLSNTSAPRLFAQCTPQEAEIAAPLVAKLGPRAHLRSDPAAVPGRCIIEES
ncbi:MAG TPA: RNA-binding protein [Brevundimonas sp.]|jgi:Ribonuclease G/E